MTEAEWLAGPELWQMLDHLDAPEPERLLRLFAAACCRRVEHLLFDARLHAALAGVERRAEGRCDADELAGLQSAASGAIEEIEAPLYDETTGLRPTDRSLAAGAVLNAAEPQYGPAAGPPGHQTSALGSLTFQVQHALGYDAWERNHDREETDAAVEAEARRQAGYLRDIFGNPFRPAVLAIACRTPTVLAIANGIYADRAFDRLPILADALEEAGCEDEDVLSHCRQPGEHVRGCWVIDLVLSRR